MAVSVYKPFERFIFTDKTCFISGEEALTNTIPVFPDWILEEHQLRDKPFKLLDESITTYNDMRVPVSANVLLALNKLENEVADAFKAGYEAVKELDQILLFQWAAKLLYGMIYHETTVGIKQQASIGEQLTFSQSLVHKFSNFHLMLQSVIQPVVFEGGLPWSILIFPVKNEAATFSYRDEINTLTFSLRMNDFGIIGCLQDNGANARYHKEILAKVGQNILSPLQFEELCGRFFYSAYLFNRLPEYTILPAPEAVYVEAMPLRGISNKPLFDEWLVKTYGKVLENFWKTWGYSLFEIIKDLERPMSFLLDEHDNFISDIE